MLSINWKIYNELDPKKKDVKWGDLCIQILRRDWRRLIASNRALGDRSALYSVEELPDIKNSFDDEDFKKNTKFQSLPILEPIINSVVEGIIRNPPKAELKALDPTAIVAKKQDIELIKHRPILEKDRSELHSRVGLPPYKLGKENFEGNVEEFDKLGFDSTDSEDVNFYENNLQKLNAEIAGQSVLDAVFKNSRFDKDIIRRLVKDVFAFKAISLQKYIDQITGEIKDKYIDPQNAYGIFGKTNDGKDDICRGWQDSVTVMQWLELVGDQFNFERDWRFLLWGINYCNVRQFTGFIRNGTPFDCCGNAGWMGEMGLQDITTSNLVDWSMAYTYKVYVGYIEWRSPEATSTFLTNKNNNAFVEEIPHDILLDERQIRDGYQKESRYQMPWYSSYFIATTSVSQWVWGFGKVYFQNTYGANDEYSNGTLCYYQEEGLSAVEISRPYMQMANTTFYRMLWVIYKAKPDPDEFVYDELLQLANITQRQFPQGGTAGNQAPGLANILTDIIKQQRAKHVRLRTYPRIDGRPVQQIHPIEQKGRGGLDPLAISMQAVCQWAEAQIAQKIGLNPMRLGQNPPPRESNKSENETVQFSMQTTGYIYRMIQYVKEHSAIACLNYAQDIIKYKDSLPYKWLRNIVGVESFEDLSTLDKFANHRCGLFIDDYNADVDKTEVKQAATMALQQKEISWDQWFTITQTSDYKRASKLLGRYKEKAIKQAQDFEMQKMQQADAFAEKVFQREMQKMAFDRETKYHVAEIDAQSFIASAQTNSQGRINTQQLKDAASIQHQIIKNDGEVTKEKVKGDLENQKPLGS